MLGGVRARAGGGPTPIWPQTIQQRDKELRWCDMPDNKRWTTDAADNSLPIPMKSFYFEIGKNGATSFQKKKMLETILGGSMKKLRSYNFHGR